MTPECEKALQEAYATVLLEQRNAARLEVAALKGQVYSLRSVNESYLADITDWMCIADGVKHDPRCDPPAHPCLRCREEEYRRIAIEFGEGLVGSGRAGMIDMDRLLKATWDLDRLEKACDDLSALINPEDQ